MIPTTVINVTGSITNPDKVAITQKEQIDIRVNRSDVTLTKSETEVQLNALNTEIILLNDDTVTNSDSYYTPIYTEKISYSTWKSTINKSFLELRND